MVVCTVAAVTTIFLSMHSERFCDLISGFSRLLCAGGSWVNSHRSVFPECHHHRQVLCPNLIGVCLLSWAVLLLNESMPKGTREQGNFGICGRSLTDCEQLSAQTARAYQGCCINLTSTGSIPAQHSSTAQHTSTAIQLSQYNDFCCGNNTATLSVQTL